MQGQVMGRWLQAMGMWGLVAMGAVPWEQIIDMLAFDPTAPQPAVEGDTASGVAGAKMIEQLAESGRALAAVEVGGGATEVAGADDALISFEEVGEEEGGVPVALDSEGLVWREEEEGVEVIDLDLLPDEEDSVMGDGSAQ